MGAQSGGHVGGHGGDHGCRHHGHHQPRVDVVDDGESEADRPFFLLVGNTERLWMAHYGGQMVVNGYG